MNPRRPARAESPVRLTSPSGLSVEVNANGSVRRMDCGDIILNLFLGNEIEGGPANLYLRCHRRQVDYIPLLGPRCPGVVYLNCRSLTVNGQWQGIHFHLALVLSQSARAWFWHVRLRNEGGSTETVDLLYAQDLGLAHYGAVRINEYYTSHYVDHTPLAHPQRGFVVASRQNLSMAGKNPWTVIGTLGRAISYATDALQIHGLATRAGHSPAALTQRLPGTRLQHEHSMVALQDEPVPLGPGAVVERGFFGWFEEDHPAASTTADLAFVERALALPEATFGRHQASGAGAKPAPTLFSTAALLAALDLTEAESRQLFGPELREPEREDGRLLSFFTGKGRHVVLKAKEIMVLRPHGHMLRTGAALVPDESSLTSTTWMAGVFHSLLTQGHVSINRFLSATHSYLGLARSDGLRIFVELAAGWHLLDLPSAYEMAPDRCRWIYKHRGGLIAVEAKASTRRHLLTLAVEVLCGEPTRLLFSLHVAIDGDDGSEPTSVRYAVDEKGAFVRALPDSDVGRRFPAGGLRIEPRTGTVLERVGTDELLFADQRSRNQPFLCLVTAPSLSPGFTFTGTLVPETTGAAGAPASTDFWDELTGSMRIHPPPGSPLAAAATRLGEIVPWFIHNAVVHYLSPRGLEQYTGGGWGTRDVCQGPVEMLLALGRFEPIRDLLVRVFEAQNLDGDWPQWFMFFDRERNIRAPDSHGDIVFWPLLALANYLAASQDGSLLEEKLSFFHPQADQATDRAPLWQHVERALALIERRFIPGTHLVAYGQGDWNDAMQPAQPDMREKLCSAWTVALHYQTLEALACALRRLGQSSRAAECEAMGARVREDFQRFLVVDDTVAGFAYYARPGRVDYLLHPRDRLTGISYSLLPMIHAIIDDLLTPEQAEKHLGYIEAHLLAPDGARLFDRSMEYRGGPQRYFQRAESAAFFGREIGLMYTHAHLRYAEALAHYGDAEGFFRALCQANPIGIRTLVASATPRQANCYYSSSDAAFADRYQAFAEYERVKTGAVPLDGGWRVYSSGPGIATRLILQCFLGLRQEKSLLAIDPVIPKSLDGLRVETNLAGSRVEILYRIRVLGHGPTSVKLNGAEVSFTHGHNPYRTGAAEIPIAALRKRLIGGTNRITVCLE